MMEGEGTDPCPPPRVCAVQHSLTVSAGHADVDAAALLVDVVRFTFSNARRHRVQREILELRRTTRPPWRRHVLHLHVPPHTVIQIRLICHKP